MAAASFFRTYNETPTTPYDHILCITTFFEDLNGYIEYWWTNTTMDQTNSYEAIITGYRRSSASDLRLLQQIVEKKVLNRKFGGIVSEEYFVKRYLKANGVYKEELLGKLNFTASLGNKTRGKINRNDLKQPEDEFDRRVNEGLLDWLMNFIESLIEYFKLNHYLKEILGIIKVFVSGLIL